MISDDKSLINASNEQAKASCYAIDKIDQLNWWFLLFFKKGNKNIEKKPVPDFECIHIGICVTKMKLDKKSYKKIELHAIGIKSNLYSMITINIKGDIKLL